MTIRTHAVRSLLIGAAALAVATPAWAQTDEEDAGPGGQRRPRRPAQGDLIIVTATKRASTVQDVPFSINAQTQEDIQRANANTIEDISRNVAGLAVQNLGPGQSQVSVRGVSAGQIVRDQPGVKEQVGVYLDESVISLSLFTPDFDLFDLNRVETLRGPQGTLFGSGSVGGTHPLHHQPAEARPDRRAWSRPTSTTSTTATSAATSRARSTFRSATPRRSASSAYATKYAGFIDALGPAGGKDVNDGNRIGGRVSLLWQPTDELKITPRVVYQKVEADGFNREEVFNLYLQPVHHAGRTIYRRARAISAAAREVQGRDAARRPDRVLRLRRRRADLGHQLHQPRHPGQPRRLGADRLGVRRSSA